MSENKKDYIEIDKVSPGMKTNQISGTKFREMLENGEKIPDWFSFLMLSKNFKKHIQ